MARTAHHLPSSRTKKTVDDRPGAPWHSVILLDLRYSARCFVEAAHHCHRPLPRAVRRQVDVYCFPRHNRDRGIARWSALEERRARQRLRTQVGVIRRLVNTSGGELALIAADMVDVTPANHRHSSLWLS
ncbi:hypothetical protein ACFZBE_25695 [Streptomyces sp. NPDC008061]|uniref:hypothetical protein n=1 Tax=Streptomyces sp. NPDC008061 TaxID=3364805 RepID=UPI0036DFAB5D